MRRNALALLVVGFVSLLAASSAFGLTFTGFSPNSGLPAKDNGEACPGNTIMITGSGFVNDGPASAVQVLFNGVPAYVEIGSDSTLYAVVPGTATTGPITVSDAAGSITSTSVFAGSAATFYVNPCPQVSLSVAEADPSLAAGVASTPSFLGKHSVAPTSGGVGSTVTLSGYDFYSVTGASFGSVKASFTIVSPTKITLTVPKGAASGKIKLTYVINATVSEGGIVPNPTVNGDAGNPAAVTYTPLSFKVT
jgi:large repetitive protein